MPISAEILKKSSGVRPAKWILYVGIDSLEFFSKNKRYRTTDMELVGPVLYAIGSMLILAGEEEKDARIRGVSQPVPLVDRDAGGSSGGKPKP